MEREPLIMGLFSSTWSDQAREHDRERKASARDKKRRARDRKARRRREFIEHPVRSAWRSR
jgi:hypothetical protein